MPTEVGVRMINTENITPWTRPSFNFSSPPTSPSSSASKRRHNVAFLSSPSPRRTRLHLQSAGLSNISSPIVSSSNYMYNLENNTLADTAPLPPIFFENLSQDSFNFNSVVSQTDEPEPIPAVLSDGEQLRLQQLEMEMETHSIRLSAQEAMMEGKGTEEAYPRHQLNYEKWWQEFQETKKSRDATWVTIPAHPVTATKVALFLDHESKRPKRNRQGAEIPGTLVGPSHIRQCISALEFYRKAHMHEDVYKNSLEAHISLRNDIRVTTVEKSCRADEPKRREQAQILKAIGTSLDTHTEDQITQEATRYLTTAYKGKRSLTTAHRDRAMQLMASGLAGRGQFLRSILLSDMSHHQIPLPDKDLAAKIDVLLILSDQSKVNTSGRVEENGMIRHRHPELCGVGALGFYLFCRFHLMSEALPEFEPDFTDQEHGEYGRRDWAAVLLFPGGKDKTKEMTYGNHRVRRNISKINNQHTYSKVTHAARPYGARMARLYGADASDTQALGHWKAGRDSTVYKECYDNVLPMNALLANAMFNGRKHEMYSLPRSQLGPPVELVSSLFPWVEQEQEALAHRQQVHGHIASDIALDHFLKLVIWLRQVILQDAAVLSVKYPMSQLFTHPPFNTPLFHSFAVSSAHVLQDVEATTRAHLARLPEVVASSFCGVISDQTLRAQQDHNDNKQAFADLHQRLNMLTTLVSASMGSSTRKRKALDGFQALQSAATAPLSLPLPSVRATPPSEPPLPTVEPTSASISVADPGPILAPPELLPIISKFSLSSNMIVYQRQIEALESMIKRYPVQQITAHTFEWIQHASPSLADEWLPVYDFQRCTSLEDVWMEYTVGLNGFLSVRQLEEGWAARWKRNNTSRKSEHGRRRRVIELIEKLAKKPNWNYQLALRFLAENYPISPSSTYKTVRSFTDYLQNKTKGAIDTIIAESNSYP